MLHFKRFLLVGVFFGDEYKCKVLIKGTCSVELHELEENRGLSNWQCQLFVNTTFVFGPSTSQIVRLSFLSQSGCYYLQLRMYKVYLNLIQKQHVL